MNCQEWSGAATSSPLDQATQADGTTANPSSGSVTTTSAGELILGDLENVNAPSGRSGFSEINSTTSSWLSTEYQIQASAGSIAAKWTASARTMDGTGCSRLKRRRCRLFNNTARFH